MCFYNEQHYTLINILNVNNKCENIQIDGKNIKDEANSKKKKKAKHI